MCRAGATSRYFHSPVDHVDFGSMFSATRPEKGCAHQRLRIHLPRLPTEAVFLPKPKPLPVVGMSPPAVVCSCGQCNDSHGFVSVQVLELEYDLGTSVRTRRGRTIQLIFGRNEREGPHTHTAAAERCRQPAIHRALLVTNTSMVAAGIEHAVQAPAAATVAPVSDSSDSSSSDEELDAPNPVMGPSSSSAAAAAAAADQRENVSIEDQIQRQKLASFLD